MFRKCFVLLALVSSYSWGENLNEANLLDDDSNNAHPQKSQAEILQQVKENLVFIEGGRFVMGGSKNKYYYSDVYYRSGKEHDVNLTSFYISKFKVTNEEFQAFLQDKNISLNYKLGNLMAKHFASANSNPRLPAHMYWQEAHDYCSWLADKTGMQFALPTEAQWDYVMQTGEHKDPLYASPKDKLGYAQQHQTGLGYLQALPGDFYSPNLLGVYDLKGNGFEWMQDWYDPKYYNYSPEQDPQGPEEPVSYLNRLYEFKSVRGYLYGFTDNPNVRYKGKSNIRIGFPLEMPAELLDLTVRCVVNEKELVNEN